MLQNTTKLDKTLEATKKPEKSRILSASSNNKQAPLAQSISKILKPTNSTALTVTTAKVKRSTPINETNKAAVTASGSVIKSEQTKTPQRKSITKINPLTKSNRITDSTKQGNFIYIDIYFI